MAEYDTKSQLISLMRTDGNQCFECNSPSPQWASVSYGTYICLSCSGQHRSLGVHLSFVRSLTMDKWSDVQVKKMQLGGNKKCKAFFEAAPDYRSQMAMTDKYNSLFAAQYRDKLAAEVEGREWDPSMTAAPAALPSATSALRKPRNGGASRSTSPLPPSHDASPFGESVPAFNSTTAVVDTSYFSGLGQANASRSDNLKPSEGGKYGGFGSQGSWNPSQDTSSKAVPTLEDLQRDPGAALSRGWGLFSTALSQASKSINDNLIQPGITKAADPNLQSTFAAYASSATRTLGEGARQGTTALSGALRAGGEFAHKQGLDVGDMGAGYLEQLSHRQSANYAQVGSTEARNRNDGNDDFFNSHLGGASAPVRAEPNPWSSTTSETARTVKPVKAASAKKDDGDWDQWND